MDGTTLHIHTLCLCKKDEVNSILLATHFGVVDEIRVHNFHLYRYLFRGHIHVRIAQSHWGAVQTVLSYVSRRVGEEEGKPIKITFDEFLRPAIEAWRAGIPYAGIVFHLPESELEPIVEGIRLPHIHANLRGDEQGYSSESDREVDLENDELEFRQDDEILTFFGQRYIPAI